MALAAEAKDRATAQEDKQFLAARKTQIELDQRLELLTQRFTAQSQALAYDPSSSSPLPRPPPPPPSATTPPSPPRSAHPFWVRSAERAPPRPRQVHAPPRRAARPLDPGARDVREPAPVRHPPAGLGPCEGAEGRDQDRPGGEADQGGGVESPPAGSVSLCARVCALRHGSTTLRGRDSLAALPPRHGASTRARLPCPEPTLPRKNNPRVWLTWRKAGCRGGEVACADPRGARAGEDRRGHAEEVGERVQPVRGAHAAVAREGPEGPPPGRGAYTLA